MVELKLFIWALIAGSFVPRVGILNGRAGWVLGNPLFACVLVFFVGLVLALAVTTLPEEGFPISKVMGNLKGLNILPAFWLHFTF